MTAITGIPTGTVTFKDGATTIGTGTLVNGVATITESGANLTTLGLHPITAVYNGDANFVTSTSAVFNQYVVPLDTTITLTTAPNPSTQSNATFTANIAIIGGSGPLTGNVTFYEDGVLIPGTVTFDPATGVATIMPNNLHFGAHNITAIYSGDTTTFAMATSNTVIQYVQQTDMLITSTTLTTSLATAYYCQNVTLTATVTEVQGFYDPTGSVTFFSNGVAIGTSLLNNLGVAQLTLATLPVGTTTLRATYNSDSNYAFSFSNNITQNIIANPTTTTLTIIPNLTSTPYGQDLFFVGTVTSSFGIPTGSITFTDGTNDLATIDLDATGHATYETSTIAVGTYVMSAIYNADPCFITSTGTLTHTIAKVNPTMALTTSPNPSIYGDDVLVTATLSSIIAETPTGTITFYNGSTAVGTVFLENGIATITLSNLPAGITLIGATYSGNNNYLAATLPSKIQVVNKAATNVCLNSYSANPSVFGETVTFNATVSSTADTPTGSVVFRNGSTVIGTVPLTGCGTATLNTTNLNLGANTITATYLGDSNFSTATSSSLIQNVVQADSSITVVSSTPNPSVYNSLVTFNLLVENAGSGTQIPTGTVTGYFGSTVLGTATLTGGVAVLTTSVLPTGVDTVIFKYSGDTNFTTSSTATTQTVTPLGTTTTLASSNNPSVVGQSVTFNINVTSTAGTPTGTVTLLDGTTTLATRTLSTGGSVSITISDSTVGTHSFRATYSGSTNLSASTSNTVSQVVNKAATTTVLSSSNNPSFFGQTVTYSAFVSVTTPGSGIPTGTVTFRNGATTIGTGTLNSAGIATFTTSSLAASGSTYSITAVYGGDTNFLTSTSAILNQTVNKSATITSATATPNPSALGSSVTLNISVVPVNIGSGTPTGTVTAFYGSTVVGTATLNGSGQATFSTTSLPAGTLGLVVQYGGDTNYLASSTAITETVTQIASTVALTSSLNPSTLGSTVTFTATVTSTSGIPTGLVSFFDGITSIATVTLSPLGVATFTTTNLSLGTHLITAVYRGDTNHLSNTSNIIAQVVNQGATTISLSSVPNPSEFGNPVTFKALVTTVNGGLVLPTGTITFKNGAATLATVNVDSNGESLLLTSTLPIGVNSITAVYNGDVNFTTSTSSVLSQTVNKTDTIIHATTTPNPSALGSAVTFNFTVSPINTTGVFPSGTVNAFYGSTLVGTATLNGAGQGTFNTSSLPAGTLAIVLNYLGDTNFNTSSTTVTQTVSQVASTNVLTSSLNPSTVGALVTFTATVGSTSGTPTGTVSFFDGTTALATVTLNGSGIATYATSSLILGTHAITAVYNGDISHSGLTSNIVSQVVNQATTTTTLTSSLNPSAFGTSVTFTALVTTANGGIIAPTGTIAFKNGATTLATVNVDANGEAQFTTSALPIGVNSMTAVYSGNTSFSTSTSTILSQTVNKADTKIVATTTPNPSALGSAVTFNFTVSPINATGVFPSGTVNAFLGSTLVGTATLNGTGQGTFTTSSLPAGTSTIVLNYLGDTNFNTSSTTVTQTVSQVASTNVLTSSLNPSTVGALVTFTATVGSTSGTPTGTVSFFDGTTALATVTLNGSGVATYPTSNLTLGTHAVTAVYNGDTNHLGLTSNIVSQVVNQATTTTTLNAIQNPSEYGNPVTFKALVTTANGGLIAPTGTIAFKNGATTLATVNVDANGEALFLTSALPIGVNSITAVYSGNTNFTTSTSAVLSQTVNKTDTVIHATATPNPSNFGSPVTFNITVNAINTTGVFPSGTVNAYYGSTLVGTVILDGAGQGTFTTSTLPAGTLGIVMDYLGDTNFNASTKAITQTVTPATSSTVLVSSVNPSLVGQPVTFTATVTSSFGTPTGMVALFDGTTAIAAATLNGSGVATFTLSNLTLGLHMITVGYGGDSNTAASVSNLINQVVNQTSTTTSLVSSLNPSAFQDVVTFTAQVSPIAPGSGIPTGSVTFKDGATVIGIVNLDTLGVALFSTMNLAPGSHTITATYSGDVNFTTSVSSSVIQVVTKANTVTTILSSTPNPSMFGEVVTFFATVTSDATLLPSGTVTFYDGLTMLGTVPLSDGLGIFATPALALGAHPITAVYSGDTNFNVSTSTPPYVQTVNQTTITVTTVTNLTSDLNPSNYGDLVTFDVTITPIAGPGTPTGVVTLYHGSMPLVTLPLVGGHISYSTSTLPAGNLNIVALYSGDSAYSSSTQTIIQVVNPITTITTIASSLNPSNFTDPVMFTAHVAATNLSVPTGSVTFYDGVTIMGTTLLNNAGNAVWTASALSTGSHLITAVYNADPNFLTSSDNLTQVVNPALTTTIVLTASPNPSKFGETVTFIATTVSAANNVSGTLTFYDGATALGTAPLYNGLAIFSTSTLSVGSHLITASYGGSTNFAPSTSLPYTQVVQSATFSTNTTLTSSNNPSEFGQNVTLTANVTSISGTPTGTVTFFDGAASIGIVAVNGSGVAALSTSTLAVGTHSITAIYSGDSNFAPSTSNVLAQVVGTSTIPNAPEFFYGCQIFNKFTTQANIINRLRWELPETGATPTSYMIYRNAALTDLVAVVPGDQFVYDDAPIRKNTRYRYYIVAVSSSGVSSAAVTTVYPHNQPCRDCNIDKLFSVGAQYDLSAF